MAGVGALVCGAAAMAAAVPGLICAVMFAFEGFDHAYVDDEFNLAAANNDCMRIPQYVPWADPIPYNGTECRS